MDWWISMQRQMAGDNTHTHHPLHINTLHFRVQIPVNPLSFNTRTYVGTRTIIRLHYPILYYFWNPLSFKSILSYSLHYRSAGWWKSPASGSLSRKKVRECRRKYRVMQQFTTGECRERLVPSEPNFNINILFSVRVWVVTGLWAQSGEQRRVVSAQCSVSQVSLVSPLLCLQPPPSSSQFVF